MLKRRASKRFVLAETGEETAWTTTDNDACGIIPQIDIESVQKPEEADEEEQFQNLQQIQQLQEKQPEVKAQINQRLSVPQLAKP